MSESKREREKIERDRKRYTKGMKGKKTRKNARETNENQLRNFSFTHFCRFVK